MDIANLQNKIRALDEKRKPRYKLYTQTEKEILTRTIKLNEEVGELCNDILAVLALQRKAKLKLFDKRNLYAEFADVILTTMQLANAMGVNLDRAVKDKLRKIKERQSNPQR